MLTLSRRLLPIPSILNISGGSLSFSKDFGNRASDYDVSNCFIYCIQIRFMIVAIMIMIIIKVMNMRMTILMKRVIIIIIKIMNMRMTIVMIYIRE